MKSMQLNKCTSPGVITLFIPQSPYPASIRKRTSTFPPFALQHANKSKAQVLLTSLLQDYELLAPRTLLNVTN